MVPIGCAHTKAVDRLLNSFRLLNLSFRSHRGDSKSLDVKQGLHFAKSVFKT